MNFADWFRAEFGSLITDVENVIHTEEKEIETVITDALNALAAAVQSVLNERTADKAALVQAQADRDAAQAAAAQAATDRDAVQAALATANQQLADAETQVNALTAQLNPPAA